MHYYTFNRINTRKQNVLAAQTTLEKRNMSGTLTFTVLEWCLCLWGGAFSRILYFRI